MKYNILNSTSPRRLILLVEEAMKGGWEPVGGMVIGPGGDRLPIFYYQTMVQNPANNFV